MCELCNHLLLPVFAHLSAREESEFALAQAPQRWYFSPPSNLSKIERTTSVLYFHHNTWNDSQPDGDKQVTSGVCVAHLAHALAHICYLIGITKAPQEFPFPSLPFLPHFSQLSLFFAPILVPGATPIPERPSLAVSGRCRFRKPAGFFFRSIWFVTSSAWLVPEQPRISANCCHTLSHSNRRLIWQTR